MSVLELQSPKICSLFLSDFIHQINTRFYEHRPKKKNLNVWFKCIHTYLHCDLYRKIIFFLAV